MSHSQQRQRLRGMNAWDRHKQLMSDYQEYYGGQLPSQPVTVKTDMDCLIEQHRFIRRPEDEHISSWEAQLARRYYAKLYKEYAVIDLSRYKEGLYGMRWRSKQEVLDGKGHFLCGAKTCEERQGLCSFEVPFAYIEADQRRDALVKVRLCPKHALQLNYRKNKEVLKMQRTEHKRQQKRLRKAARKRRKSAGDQQEAAQLNALESEPETTSSSEQLDRYSGARKARTSGMHMSTLPATPAPDKQDIPPGSSPQHSPTVPAVHAKAEADQQRQAQQRWNNDGLAASSSQQEHIYCEDVEDADLLSELLM